MAVSKEFMDAVGQGNALRVKIMLKNSLLLDTSFRQFDEMLEYAKARIPGLVESHDGEAFRQQEDWDEDYMNEQLVSVVENFSAERLELLKKIVRKLRGTPSDGNPESNPSDSAKTVKIFVGAGIVIIIVIAGLTWYFFTKD